MFLGAILSCRSIMDADFSSSFLADRGMYDYCNCTATATATGMVQRSTPWYQLDTPIALTPTELHSLILRDTLGNARRGTNSTEAENQRAGHLFYAVWWTRKYNC
jgi:hypothetical protein